MLFEWLMTVSATCSCIHLTSLYPAGQISIHASVGYQQLLQFQEAADRTATLTHPFYDHSVADSPSAELRSKLTTGWKNKEGTTIKNITHPERIFESTPKHALISQVFALNLEYRLSDSSLGSSQHFSHTCDTMRKDFDDPPNWIGQFFGSFRELVRYIRAERTDFM